MVSSKPSVNIVASIVTIFIVLIIFQTTDIDFEVQNYFYSMNTGSWLLSYDDALAKTVLYDFPKRSIIVFELFIIGTILFSIKYKDKPVNIAGLAIVSISLALVPGTVALLKYLTNIACPKNLIDYGGYVPYKRLFESATSATQNYCFPASHASIGFSLLSLYFLSSQPWHRTLSILFSIALGWLMGLYKMLLGHHFLSHTVVSMALAWSVINIVALCVFKLSEYKARSLFTLGKSSVRY